MEEIIGYSWISWGILDWIFILIGILIGFPFLIFGLAQRNLMFTMIEEGTAKAIRIGEAFYKVIINFERHTIDEHWNVWDEDYIDWLIEANGESSEKLGKKQKARMRIINSHPEIGIKNPNEISKETFSGQENQGKDRITRWIQKIPLCKNIFFVGIPPFYSLHWYRFKFTSMEQGQDREGQLIYIMKTLDVFIDYVYLKDDFYAIRLEGVRTKDKVPIDVNLIIGVRIVNPYKALFKVDKWLEAAIARVHPRFRQFIGRLNFSDIDTLQRSGGEGDLSEQSNGEGLGTSDIGRAFEDFLEKDSVDEELELRYGVHLITGSVQMVDIQLDKEYAKIAATPWQAEKEARAAITEAKGESEAIKLVYTGRAEGYKELGKASRNPDLLARLAALEKTSESGNMILSALTEGEKSPSIIINRPEESKKED